MRLLATDASDPPIVGRNGAFSAKISHETITIGFLAEFCIDYTIILGKVPGLLSEIVLAGNCVCVCVCVRRHFGSSHFGSSRWLRLGDPQLWWWIGHARSRPRARSLPHKAPAFVTRTRCVVLRIVTALNLRDSLGFQDLLAALQASGTYETAARETLAKHSERFDAVDKMQMAIQAAMQNLSVKVGKTDASVSGFKVEGQRMHALTSDMQDKLRRLSLHGPSSASPFFCATGLRALRAGNGREGCEDCEDASGGRAAGQTVSPHH